MNAIMEPNRLGDVLKWEAENLYSREAVTVQNGEDLPVGAVIGQVKTSCPTEGTADGGNTGNGTCTGVSPGTEVKTGTYTLTCIEAVADGGIFEVRDPDDLTLGQAEVGTAYQSKQINFTLNDGATDFAAGDKFTITVSEGSGKVVGINFEGADGTEDPVGFLAADCDAGAGDTEAAAVVRQALIDPRGLAWPLSFASGSTEPDVGDVIEGQTSSDTARVVKVTVTSGSWAGGDAAGVLWVCEASGEFQAEDLDIPAREITNFASASSGLTITANLQKLEERGIVARSGA